MPKKLNKGKSSHHKRSLKEGLGRYRQAQRQHEVSNVISQGIWKLSQDDKKYPLGLIVTITRVVTSPEAAYANIFCQIFPDEIRGTALSYLNKKKIILRHYVSQHTTFRLAPKIHFVYDADLAEENRILELLDSIKK